MNWLCKGAGALTFFIVAVYVAAGHTTIFMPGPVSEAHRKVPGLDCRACHRPWDPIRGGTAGCVSQSCHTALTCGKISRAHEKPSCPQCHVEHRATGMASASALIGAQCLGCHATTHAEQAPQTPGGAAHVYDKAGNLLLAKDHPSGLACYRCHFYHAAPRGYLPAALRPTAIPMKHSVHLGTMVEVLKVKDRFALCATCHQAREKAENGFAPFTRQGCFRNSDDCHQPKKIAGQKKFKDPLLEKPVGGYVKPQRPVNALFLHSNHVTKLKCAECHAGIEKTRRITRAPIATEALCARCHNEKKTWLSFKTDNQQH